MKIEINKKIKDKNGEIIIRAMEIQEAGEKDGTAIAEIVTQGCVICFWICREVDGCYYMAELNEVYDRLTSVEIEPENLLEAIRTGRKIANVIIDCYFK